MACVLALKSQLSPIARCLHTCYALPLRRCPHVSHMCRTLLLQKKAQVTSSSKILNLLLDILYIRFMGEIPLQGSPVMLPSMIPVQLQVQFCPVHRQATLIKAFWY
jgi:hypothetical protein